MIAASQRRRRGRADAFRLHQELASRAAWSVRLRRGAVCALIASVVGLLLRAGLVPHLLLCLAGFALGSIVPVRGAVAEAFASIRRRAGLSYETALDVLATDGADEFGLRGAVVERARLAVRDVRPEPAPAWWLPALAVALGLTLFSLGGPLGGPGTTGGAGPGLTGGPTPGSSETPAAAGADQPDDAVQPPEDAPGRAVDEPTTPERDEDEAAEGPGATPPAGEGGGAPLSRFLDSLRERPDSPADADEPGAPGSDGTQPPRADRPTSPGGEGGDTERVELERRQQGQQGEQGGEAQAEDPSQGEGGEESEGSGDGDGQDQPGDGGDEESGQDGSSGEDGAGTSPGGDGALPSGDGQPSEGQGDAQSSGLTPDDGGETGLDEALGAGAGGGQETEAGVAQSSGEPELLPGELRDGPENPAGTVRLPGDTEITIPAGRSVSDYQAAAEEALTEGDLPLEYQEIIRQYFQ